MEGSTILGFLIFSIVLIFPILVVHELAHGAALTHFGGNPGALGTGLYYFSPMFYVDTSESWRLTRGKRVIVSMAGPMSTLFIGSVAGLLAHFNVVPGATYLFQMTFFFSYYIVLLNLAPMFETDGYFTLMDSLNIPNLRSEAFGYIKTLVSRGPRQANLKYDEYSSKQRLAMVMYGAVSIIWSVFIIYLSYLFFAYIVEDALTQLTNLIGSMVSMTGLSSHNIESVLISVGIAVVSLGLLTFISLRIYAMTYLPLKTVASRMQRIGSKALPIDGTYLSTFFLAPVIFPPLREKLLKKLRWIAGKMSPDSNITEEGELVHMRLTLWKNTERTFPQLRSDVMRYENVLRKHYSLYVKKLLKGMRKDRVINELYIMDEKNSAKAASVLKRSDFTKAFKERIDKVYSDIGQLLESFACFVWAVDLRPEVFAKLNPKDFEYSFLEDISTSTSIYDVGNYRRERVVGSKNIEYMLKRMGEYFSLLKEDPRIMQTTHASVLFEPVKNRLMIFGRARRVGSLKKMVEHVILTPIRSTLETTYLQGLSTSLLGLSQFVERSPTFSIENIKNTECKDLKFLNRILDDFIDSLGIVEENVLTMQRLTETVSLKMREAGRAVKTLDYDVALLGVVVGVTARELEQVDSNRTFYAMLARQNRRLLGELEGLKKTVAETIRKKEKGFYGDIRRLWLTTVIALFASAIIAFYLSSLLRELGAWNLVLLVPIFTILSGGVLSLVRALRINSKAHSPIIDSVLLLSNHYYSLATNVPSASKFLNQIT
jgi:hypothetical protein